MQDIILFMQTHWALSLALFFVFLLLILLEFVKQKTGAKQLSAAQVTRLINHDNATIVDVRTTEAFANGHIVGAISLPLKDLPDKIKKIEKFKSQPVVVVCASGQDSTRAVPLLVQKGFITYMLQGGLRAWHDAEMPIVKG